ncbi:MAG: MraY family glycosyltransferase [bacterium]|nr:MraY family glycosyltransferase [bacterium]
MNQLQHVQQLFSGRQGEISYALYALVFVVALLLTYGLTLILIRLAPRLGAMARPSARHIHLRAVPKLGGVAIFIAVTAALGLAALLCPVVARDLISAKSVAIFTGLLVMLCLGVYDDLRHASWLPKFAFQIVAACIVIHENLVISKITNPFGPTLELPMIVALLFTIVWLVGITNAVNLSDGLDGLATGIVLIVCGVTFANSLQLMQTRPEQYTFFVFSAITSVAALGASLAFLRFNFYPAKIFLGDAGSLCLGFLIACTAVRSAQISTTTVALIVPVIALGLPILDTVLAFLRRTARRRNPFQADLEHIHHKMMESGLSHPETVLVLYGFCLLLGVAALVLALKKNQYAGIVLFVLTVITLAGFKKFGVLDVTRLWGTRGRHDETDPHQKYRGPQGPRPN